MNEFPNRVWEPTGTKTIEENGFRKEIMLWSSRPPLPTDIDRRELFLQERRERRMK